MAEFQTEATPAPAASGATVVEPSPATPGVRHGVHEPSTALPLEPTRTGGDLATVYVSIAAVGIAALGSAAASSLIAGLNGAAGAALWAQGAAAAVAFAWAAAALVWALLAFRTGVPPRAALAIWAGAAAAALHLATVLFGMWRLPEELRTLDVNVAALLVLELSVLAVLGWQHNSGLRLRAGPGTGRQRSALALVGTLFAASVLVAAVTSAGLAASTAGALAVAHSGHGSHTPGMTMPINVQQLKESGHHH